MDSMEPKIGKNILNFNFENSFCFKPLQRVAREISSLLLLSHEKNRKKKTYLKGGAVYSLVVGFCVIEHDLAMGLF